MALYSQVKEFLGFKVKPRDGAVAGIPVSQKSQIFMAWRNRTTQSTNVSVTAMVYRPWLDTFEPRRVIGPVSSSGTSFASETNQASTLGLFSDGEVLVGVAVITGSITDPNQLWVQLVLGESGNFHTPLCQGYHYTGNLQGWNAGTPSGIQGESHANASVQGSLFTFQGTVVNGAGGAGDQSLTVTPPTGGRFEIESARVFNLDTAARVVSINIDDGTNILRNLNAENTGAGTSSGAGTGIGWPADPALATTGASNGTVTVAGSNRLVCTVAAVAASQDSSYALILKVWGGAPTFTLAGASTPTLTTNTSRFETG